MSKQSWRGSTLLNPEPPVLVSCGGLDHPNLITIGWTGTICTQPSMVSISVRPERFSHHLIEENREFVINVTTADLTRAADFCGVRSGKDTDKFAEMKLTPVEASAVKAPLIDQSPISLECKVKEIKHLGSHDMFIAEIVAVDVDEKYIDEKGRLDLRKAGVMFYSHGEYFAQGKKLGQMGYTVRKKRPKNPKRK